MKINERELAAIFGPESCGTTAEERARTSHMLYVRSQDHLAEFSEGATGRVISAWEALLAHGLDSLRDVLDRGSAIICDSPTTAGQNLRIRREALALHIDDVAKATGLSSTDISDAEDSTRRIPTKRLEQIARVLGLEDRWLSTSRATQGSENLTVRLRNIGRDRPNMTASAVAALAEAAWIGTTQTRLENWLDIRPQSPDFIPRPIYRDSLIYEQGYELAGETRERLGYEDPDAIPSLRSLCEDVLGIPVVQTKLPKHMAGATIVSGDTRTLVINIEGKNTNVWVRRSTYAHELCHILWDPPEELKDLRVDDYDDLERRPDAVSDPVEQRANAFSAEFIAPQKAALKLFDRTPGSTPEKLRAVLVHFDASLSVCRYQISNAQKRIWKWKQPIQPEKLQLKDSDPPADAYGRESYTADFFPIAEVPIARRGRFSAVVIAAAESRLISWNTAAEYLMTTEEKLRSAAQSIHELFPSVTNKPQQGV